MSDVKYCSHCKRDKPLSEFRTRSGGLFKTCALCRLKQLEKKRETMAAAISAGMRKEDWTDSRTWGFCPEICRWNYFLVDIMKRIKRELETPEYRLAGLRATPPTGRYLPCRAQSAKAV